MTRSQQRLTGSDRAQQSYRLALRGLTHRQIGAELHISQSAATRAVARGQRIALDSFRAEAESAIVASHARLESHYATAMASFEESRHPSPRKRSIHTDRAGAIARTASVDMLDDSPGDYHWLTEARKAVEGIRKLLGLDAPRKLKIDVQDTRPHGDSSEEQIHQELAVLFKQAGLDPATFK